MKKRILAFLLAVSIAVSVLVLPVSAASINNTALFHNNYIVGHIGRYTKVMRNHYDSRIMLFSKF